MGVFTPSNGTLACTCEVFDPDTCDIEDLIRDFTIECSRAKHMRDTLIFYFDPSDEVLAMLFAVVCTHLCHTMCVYAVKSDNVRIEFYDNSKAPQVYTGAQNSDSIERFARSKLIE